MPLNCILSAVEPIKLSYWSVYQDPSSKDLHINTKDVRTMTFTFNTDTERMEAQEHICQRAFWQGVDGMKENLFAFQYKQTCLPQPHEVNTRNSCWYNVEEEFERQGLTKYATLCAAINFHSSSFFISDLNKDYSLCSSYPKKLIFPRGATEESNIFFLHKLTSSFTIKCSIQE